MSPEAEEWVRLAGQLVQRAQQAQPLFSVSRSVPDSPVSSPSVCSRQADRRQPASSLRKICSAILTRYLPFEHEEICLKNLATELGTERRRVYDIVNILEAFDILAKKAKNLYLWKGLEEFRGKLEALGWPPGTPRLFNFESRPVKSRKKMLTYMSLKVLRFLGQQTHPIGFGEIVRLCLCGESQKDYASEKRASTTRRLYDIVNVLNALGLISKVYDEQHKKFYRWNGPAGMKSLRALKAAPRQTLLFPDSPCRSVDCMAEGQVHALFVPVPSVPLPLTDPRTSRESENLPQPGNKAPTPRMKGFQPCKDFTSFPVQEIKRFLSFSDGEGNGLP